MKAILEFNLPEEQQEFQDAQNGSEYCGILWEIKQSIRSILKYGTTDSLETVLENLRELIPTDDRLNM